MAANENQDDSLYPIAVLIDELRNEDVQVNYKISSIYSCGLGIGADQRRVGYKQFQLPGFLTSAIW